jgi:hypothetical protein
MIVDAANERTWPLTEDRFRAFGAIIHMFARHESLMVGAMSVVMDAEVVPVSMMAAELPYRGKRETLLALIKAKPLPDDQISRIAWFLGELNKRNALRNAIAHQAWKKGLRPNSIKPLGLSVRGGSVSFAGLQEDERDYTVDELIDIANELIRLYEQFRDYLGDVSLLPVHSDESGA